MTTFAPEQRVRIRMDADFSETMNRAHFEQKRDRRVIGKVVQYQPDSKSGFEYRVEFEELTHWYAANELEVVPEYDPDNFLPSDVLTGQELSAVTRYPLDAMALEKYTLDELRKQRRLLIDALLSIRKSAARRAGNMDFCQEIVEIVDGAFESADYHAE